MADGMIVSASAIYLGTAVILALGALAIVGLAVRESGRTRLLYLIGAAPAMAMAVAYVFMGMEWLTVTTAGREQSIARFVGYTIVLVGFTYIVRELLDFSWRTFVGVSVILLLTPWFALASWIATGLFESVLNGLSVVSYLVGVYLLLGPLSRISATVSGERKLLYAKLRNLFVLCWGVLILQSAISEQAIGLTNLFVGQLGASYTDLIFMFGIALLVVSGKEIFEGEEDISIKSNRSGESAVPTDDD